MFKPSPLYKILSAALNQRDSWTVARLGHNLCVFRHIPTGMYFICGEGRKRLYPCDNKFGENENTKALKWWESRLLFNKARKFTPKLITQHDLVYNNFTRNLMNGPEEKKSEIDFSEGNTPLILEMKKMEMEMQIEMAKLNIERVAAMNPYSYHTVTKIE